MSRMQRLAIKLAAVIFGSAALASCGGGSSSATPATPVAVKLQENNFGGAFGTDFRAAANSEPAVVADGDIVPVDPTTEPIPIA